MEHRRVFARTLGPLSASLQQTLFSLLPIAHAYYLKSFSPQSLHRIQKLRRRITHSPDFCQFERLLKLSSNSSRPSVLPYPVATSSSLSEPFQRRKLARNPRKPCLCILTRWNWKKQENEYD